MPDTGSAMHTAAFGLLSCLVPDWAVAGKVTAFCTTRSGGVSKPPYDALNLGLHVGDDEQAVLENRRRLQDAFALPDTPCWLRQTHSSTVLSVDSAENPAAPECADGAFTRTPGTVLAVLTADCLPVVISSVDGRELAVVHAGWRGLAAGILSAAVANFTPGLALHAWLGPAIGPDAFEVGAEVRQAFLARNPQHENAFRGARGADKYLADLYTLARTELRQERPVTVTGGDYCTVSQPDWFHSHRRDGTRSGRMATIAWMGVLPT